ncbi:M protein repeat protein [Nannizzia gypsea CBS 118893]|uniref:M protein repeat protein n=1 Tax=Arthroderma gypseum (strain ATCC MYA-4604 / CBS 118893) TaxID=535722 RepID=E4UNC6_ARTGP|nr:M protein repeat protein [Nannizzia gypsea CBS 118893]EFR00376.1 M protein repeat protein [Nannizzia gypsea CBS 118893]
MSKWKVGSFLQQAVAGVESRLDTILADSDSEAAQNAEKTEKPAEKQPGLRAGVLPPSLSRSSSSARVNDRLQERLARAMVKQPGAGGVTSPPSSTGVPSRTSSPLPADGSRTSIDSTTGNIEKAADDTALDKKSTTGPAPRMSMDAIVQGRQSNEVQPGEQDVAASKDADAEADPSKTSNNNADVNSDQMAQFDGADSRSSRLEDYEEAMAKLQADHEASELRWQEELHSYIEKIDALQAKLKYLASEAAESARNSTATAAPGTVEKKLSEKEEKIAALMEEGHKLSRTELEHRSTIKKLRQYIAESTKSQADLKRRIDKMERDLNQANDRAKRAEAAEKRATASLNKQSSAEEDLESTIAERNILKATVSDLSYQLSRASARAEAAERKAEEETAQVESRQVTELKEEISSAKVEHDLSEEKLRREIEDLKESLGREKERSRTQEVELRGEQSVLESKMESLRARAEEASSSATGDAQAKLLRQVETLQTQYAVASDNWHGIETSLLSRLASVEKERDDFAKREGDMRRKVRESALKVKRAEGDCENSREVSRELERNLEESQHEVKKLQAKVEKLEEELLAAQQDLLKQKETLDATWEQRLEDEKSKWQESIVASPSVLQARGESITPSRRSDVLSSLSEIPNSRRSSILPKLDTPPRQNSYSSLNSNPLLRAATHDTSSPLVDNVSVQTLEPDEYFSGSITPATPSVPGTHTQNSRGAHDVVSASTVAAGPSVQLVERMSATVRRLESERAGFKDELERITSQRDEARREVVELMKEVEEKRVGDDEVRKLEEQVQKLNERYQTTLEMLGEKSEQVEELKADIADLKDIYRDTLQKHLQS